MHECEAPVDDEQRDDRTDERRRCDGERDDALAEDLGDRLDVAGQAGDDRSGSRPGEIAKRELREVVEQVAPDPEHDLLSERDETAHDERLDEPADNGDADVDRDIEE